MARECARKKGKRDGEEDQKWGSNRTQLLKEWECVRRKSKSLS